MIKLNTALKLFTQCLHTVSAESILIALICILIQIVNCDSSYMLISLRLKTRDICA